MIAKRFHGLISVYFEIEREKLMEIKEGNREKENASIWPDVRKPLQLALYLSL